MTHWAYSNKLLNLTNFAETKGIPLLSDEQAQRRAY